MIRGIYTSAAGMLCETIRQDIIANNLANVDTVGFKEDMAVFKELPTMDIRRVNEKQFFQPNPFRVPPYVGKVGTGAVIDEVYTSNQVGQMQYTNNGLDVALANKDAHFVVQGPDGKLKYSRDGVFTLDEEGYIKNTGGDYLMAYDAEVNLEESPLLINKEGEQVTPLQRIQAVGDKVEIDVMGRVVVDGVGLYDVATAMAEDRKAFRKEGANKLVRAYGEVTLVEGNFKPGYVEKPNVSVVEQMVKMIEVSRAYEANSKAIQSHDSLTDKAVNTVGASRR